MKSTKKVLVVMGSKSDLSVVESTLKTLDEFNVAYEARVISAHRTPLEAHDVASKAKENGFDVIIGVAGKAAHLAGVLAAYTVLPVIALPIQTSLMGGLDSLLSMVQMPKGVPVATVAVNGGENAAILATQILALGDEKLTKKLQEYKIKMHDDVMTDDNEILNKYK